MTNQNQSKTIKTSFIVKLTMSAVLLIMMLAAFLQLNTTHAHAATNDTYMVSIINSTFGQYSSQALKIAQCESTLNPNAVNSQAIGNSHAEGLFQILYPSTWSGTSQASASPFDPRANAQAAHDIFARDGFSWREWQCHI